MEAQLVMKKYQVKNYFQWGPLKLEPLDYLTVSQSEYPRSYSVTSDKNGETIMVTKRAFENQLKMGSIVKS